MIKNAWYCVGWAHEFAPRGLTQRILVDRPILIWRGNDGVVRAFDDRCPHKAFPLSRSKILENGNLQCAYHGSQFTSPGVCVAMPDQRPDQHIPPAMNLSSYPVGERGGAVWVWPGEPEKAKHDAIPDTARVSSGEYDAYFGDPLEVKCSFRGLVDNLMDFTHFYPLHDGTIGNVENNAIPVEVETRPGYVSVRRYVENYNLPPSYRDWFGFEVGDREHQMELTGPGLINVVIRLAPRGKLGTDAETGFVIHHCPMPTDERNFIYRWSLTAKRRDNNGNSLADAIGKTVNDTIIKEDLWALNEMGSIAHLDKTRFHEVAVPSDKALVAARRMMSTLEQEEENQR
jgi:vanillate O-demethylase monooxygenase subunit